MEDASKREIYFKVLSGENFFHQSILRPAVRRTWKGKSLMFFLCLPHDSPNTSVAYWCVPIELGS